MAARRPVASRGAIPPVNPRRRAITLPEVLTVVMVVSIIMGTVVSIYINSMRAYARGSTESYAQQKASAAIERMIPDIRMGMSVVPGVAPHEASYIAIELPQRDFDSGEGTYLNHIETDGDGRPYLTPGGWVVYYRGDEDGNPAVDGDHVWRRLVADDGATILKQTPIVDNVVDNPPDGSGQPKPMFIYWPDMNRLQSVEITVTVREKRGIRVTNTTMTGEVALRNR